MISCAQTPFSSSPITIAVDGSSASGKGALARRLGKYFSYAHLDTGLLYRAVGLAVLEAGGDPSDAVMATEKALALDAALMLVRAKDPLYQKLLRNEATSQAASKVSALAPVRAALLGFQKAFVARPPDGFKGSVLDGRDIGTVIAPKAEVKIFLSASPDVRAHRRWVELVKEHPAITEESVLAEMLERDHRDATRSLVPTEPALDAFVLDSSDLSLDEVFEASLGFCAEKGLIS